MQSSSGRRFTALVLFGALLVAGLMTSASAQSKSEKGRQGRSSSYGAKSTLRQALPAQSGSRFAIASADEFATEGGWAIIDTQTANQELVHYDAADPATDELTGLERPQEEDHPVGAEVQIAHPQDFVTLAADADEPAGSTIAVSIDDSSYLDSLMVENVADFDATGGWALLSPNTEKAEPVFYSGVDTATNSLTAVTRLEPSAQPNASMVVTSAAVDTCSDMQDCDPTPAPVSSPTPPIGISYSNPPTLSRTPTGEVLVVDANIKQVYLDDVARREHFADRLKALASKPLKQDLDGMAYAPDVVVLQEVKCAQADNIAAFLNGRIRMAGAPPNDIYATAICKAWPTYVSESTSALTIVNETALIINTYTMKPLDGGTYVTTKYDSTQKCTAAGSPDSDGDSEPDCGKIQYKRHFMMSLQEKEAGGKKIAVASVHLATSDHLKVDGSTHKSRANAWVQKIDNKLRSSYPSVSSYSMTGDFNIRRCEQAPQTGDGTKELVSCTQRAWWSTLNSRSYQDAVFATRAGGAARLEPWLTPTDQRDLDVVFYDGYKNTPANPSQVLPVEWKKKNKRFDFAFTSGQAPRAAGSDITCGINFGSSSIRPNCDDAANPASYSDHRLLWTLMR